MLVVNRVQSEGLTYLSSDAIKRLELAMREVVDNGAQGDFLEFGIALGGSAIIIAEYALRNDRAFHGFDVFGMIPEPTSEKDGIQSRERYKVIASGQVEGIQDDQLYYGYRANLYNEVVERFDRFGLQVDGTKIVLHKGRFETSWPAYQGTRVAFAHLDCDWYDPVKYCLEKVAVRLSPGGIIVVDDYCWWEGCKAATDEFIASTKTLSVDHGPNLILRKSIVP